MINLADGEMIKEPEANIRATSPTLVSQSDVPTDSTPRPRRVSQESTASVTARQHEMLRRVLAASDEKKGASFPVRAPPVSRPTLAVLTDQQAAPSPFEEARPLPKVTFASSPGRQTSFRFRRLIFRLRSKPIREIETEPSFSEPSTLSAASDTEPGRGAGLKRDSDGEDWDREFLGSSEGVEQDYAQPLHLDGKMELTSEGIPHLLAKATELRHACLRELALLQTRGGYSPHRAS